MKRQLFLNKRLHDLDLFQQNIYLGSKIMNIQPAIKTNKRKAITFENVNKANCNYIYNF